MSRFFPFLDHFFIFSLSLSLPLFSLHLSLFSLLLSVSLSLPLSQEAKYHMKRCIDSGLWVPNSRVDLGVDDDDKEDDDKDDEPKYEELKKETAGEEKEEK